MIIRCPKCNTETNTHCNSDEVCRKCGFSYNGDDVTIGKLPEGEFVELVIDRPKGMHHNARHIKHRMHKGLRVYLAHDRSLYVLGDLPFDEGQIVDVVKDILQDRRRSVHVPYTQRVDKVCTFMFEGNNKADVHSMLDRLHDYEVRTGVISSLGCIKDAIRSTYRKAMEEAVN
jgi:hypothetical protein